MQVLLVIPLLALAQEPVIVRLRDAVGDTIDAAERDSFRLFPHTVGFDHAVILALPGPEFFAKVMLAPDDTSRPVFLRIMPGQLERIRFLIDNRDDVADHRRSDSLYARALASFWQEIEKRPLCNLAGEPASRPMPALEPATTQEAPPPPDSVPPYEPPSAQQVPAPPPESVTADKPRTSAVTSENRYNYTLHGTTLGSCVGGCIGSGVGIEEVSSGGGPGYACEVFPTYAVNHPVFWTTTCGLTALGSVGGYLVGAESDRSTLPASTLPNEGTGWRTACAIGAAIPGLFLGACVAGLAGWLHYGVTGVGSIENDPHELTVLPGVLTGLCVAVEVTTIGYRIGRGIDRRRAEEAEAKRRALGH